MENLNLRRKYHWHCEEGTGLFLWESNQSYQPDATADIFQLNLLTSRGTILNFQQSGEQSCYQLRKVPDGINLDVVDVVGIIACEDASTVVALNDGHLLHIRGERVEVVGSMMGGLVAFVPAPDDANLVVAITAERSNPALLLIRLSFYSSEDFEEEEMRISVNVESEVSLGDLHAPTIEGVSVGWGRKETQFHGKAGKKAAQTHSIVNETRMSGDDGRVRVSWCPDGEFFAISCMAIKPVEAETPYEYREIYVFNRKGELHSRKEPTEGLLGAMAWRKDGSLIAAHQIRNDTSHSIVFFERNGLRHGEFSLPLLPSSTAVVQELHWNSDGNILAVEWNDGLIDLWLCRNYHWYHKQRLLPISKGERQVFWSNNNPKRLCILSGSTVVGFEFIPVFIQSEECDDSIAAESLSLVAVVDGINLQLTPLAIANVPPPMAFHTLTLPTIPAGVVITRKSLHVGFHDRIVEYSYRMNDDGELELAEKKSLTPFSQPILSLVKWKECKVAALLADNSWMLLEEMKSITMDIPKEDYFGFLPDSRLVTLHNHHLYIDGTLIDRSTTSFLVHPFFLCASDGEGNVRFYPLKLPIDQWARITAARDEEEAIRPTHELGALLVTTIPKEGALVLQMLRGNLETVFPRAFLVAQVRRLLDGCRYRDAFVLCRRHRIDLNILYDHNPDLFMATLGKFVTSMEAVDHLNLFITSLRNEDVTSTRYRSTNDDTPKTTTTFKDNKVNFICQALRRELDVLDRVHYAECIISTLVCQEPADLEGALRLIVELTEGLSTRETTIKEDIGDIGRNKLDKTLKYLLFMIPAEKLYPVALGMYHLPLALTIARRATTLDPCDYVPLLEALNQEESMLRRYFLIDDHLQRYERAWRHLYEAERAKFNEKEWSLEGFPHVLDYIQRHELFQSAFTFFAAAGSDNTMEFRRLCLTYSQYEAAKPEARRQRMAVDLLIWAREWKKAREEAIRTVYWQKAAQLLAHDCEDGETSRWCGQMIAGLREHKRYREALQFADTYLPLEQLLPRLDLAIEGHLWLEGARIVHRHHCKHSSANKMDLSDEDSSARSSPLLVVDMAMAPLIDAALVAHGEALREVEELVEKFEERARRLETIQSQLVTELDPQSIRAALEKDDGSGSQAISSMGDQMSTLSMRTGISSRTSSTLISNLSRVTASKSRRKTDRQRTRGKPGSPFEREYLRDSLREIIDRTTTMQMEGNNIHDLIQFLSDVGKWDEARSLQDCLIKLVEMVQLWTGKLARLVQDQEAKMGPEVLGALGLTPWSIPPTLKIDHAWKTAFELPPHWGKSFTLTYLERC